MKKLIILPMWLFVRLITPILPSTHPWYKKKFTLKDWADGSTKLNYFFSIVLWFYILLLIF